MARILRSESEIYLIGYEEFQILGCKLPTNRHVLQVFFYNHLTVNSASNTGVFNGACVLLEQMIDRPLLALACRHHIYEIILGAVFSIKLGPTSGPAYSVFLRFQKEWKQLDKQKFQPGIANEFVKKSLADVGDDMIIFCKRELKKPIVRHDYQELLQLTLIFLGAYMEKVSFRSPGRIMFKSQFKLNSREEKSFRDIVVHIIRHHIKAWFRCGYAIEAPQNDLSFMKAIHEHSTIDKEISHIAVAKFANHLWYLSDESILFALFDDNVSFDEKRKMTQVLTKYMGGNMNDGNTDATKKYVLNLTDIDHFVSMKLYNFITPRSIAFFYRFDISMTFLDSDPSTWENDSSKRKISKGNCC